MTPEQRAAKAMDVFKDARFDPVAFEAIEGVMSQAIRAADADAFRRGYEAAREQAALAVESHDPVCGVQDCIAAEIRDMQPKEPS